jgi:hypothetical protein
MPPLPHRRGLKPIVTQLSPAFGRTGCSVLQPVCRVASRYSVPQFVVLFPVSQPPAFASDQRNKERASCGRSGDDPFARLSAQNRIRSSAYRVNAWLSLSAAWRMSPAAAGAATLPARSDDREWRCEDSFFAVRVSLFTRRGASWRSCQERISYCVARARVALIEANIMAARSVEIAHTRRKREAKEKSKARTLPHNTRRKGGPLDINYAWFTRTRRRVVVVQAQYSVEVDVLDTEALLSASAQFAPDFAGTEPT